jgi:hypothetical protein
MAYKIIVRNKHNKRCIKQVATYKEAYYTVTEELIKSGVNLSYSMNLKYLLNGFGNRKIFPFGSSKVQFNQITYNIEEN